MDQPTSSTPPAIAGSSSQPIQSSTGYFKPPPVQFNYDSAKAAAAGVSHYSNQSQGRNHHLGDQRTQFIPNHSIEISQPIQLQVPIWEGYNLVKALNDERNSHDHSSNDPLPRTNSYWGSDNWLLHHDAIKADFNNGIKFPYHKFTQSKKDAFVEEVNERVNFYMPVVSGVPYRPGQLGLSVAASNQLMGLDGSCPKPDFDYTQDYSTRSSALVKLSDQPCLMFVGGKEAVKDGESTNDINRFTRSLEAWCQSVKGLSWTILGDKSSNWNPLYKLYTSQEDDNKIASALLNKLSTSIAYSCLSHFSSTSTTPTGSGIISWLRSNYVSDYSTRAKGYHRSFTKLHPSQLAQNAGFKEWGDLIEREISTSTADGVKISFDQGWQKFVSQIHDKTINLMISNLTNQYEKKEILKEDFHYLVDEAVRITTTANYSLNYERVSKNQYQVLGAMGLSVTDGLSEEDLEMVAYLAKKAEKKSNPNWREERDGKKGAEYLKWLLDGAKHRGHQEHINTLETVVRLFNQARGQAPLAIAAAANVGEVDQVGTANGQGVEVDSESSDEQ
jgi:hypothetical protein